MERDLTKGSILKNIVLFSIPIILGNLFQQLYNIADTVIVGRLLGPSALASVGASFTLMVFLTSIIIGLCMGAGTYFSILFGRGNYKRLKNSLFTSLLIIGASALFLNILVFLFLDKIMFLMNIPSEIVSMTKDYIEIIFYGILATFLFNFFSNFLRSIGNAKISVYIIAITSILNIVLDLLFIIKFGFGIKGAAIATIISQYISALALIIYTLRKYPNYRIKREDMYIKKEVVTSILNLAIFTSIQQSIMNFGILLIQGLVNSFGTAVMAGFSSATKIEAFAYMPLQDFGNAYSTFIAQNHGAKKGDRIRISLIEVLKLILISSGIISLFIFLFSNNLIGIFIRKENYDSFIVGVKYLKIVCPFYFAIGILFSLYGIFRGVNKPKVSILLTIISLGLRVILAYSLSSIQSINLLGIWISIPIGWIIADIVGILLILKIKTN